MKTRKEYFSHDYGSRNDPKLVNVLKKHGQAGIGTYWCLIEMLYEQGGKLRIDECDSYAFALHAECEIIQSLIGNFDLFLTNKTHFWSNSVNTRLGIRREKSEKASNSAHKRWGIANALPSQSEGNAIKVKESKEKENISDDLLLFDKFRTKYPGKKRGNETEFQNFVKKHKDWKEVLVVLEEKIDAQILSRASAKPGSFVPEWKNMSTWINQRCWEEEVAPIESEKKSRTVSTDPNEW